ncbi:hypothetical protein [Methylomicrobium lacus]|uniref:hypothetical protein n=1 Tax=Methylomicrobium lacus TaxID=136992 RepID=UPI0035A8CF09
MKKMLGFIIALFVTAPSFAGKTYQVTGPVVDISESAIVIQKGKEKWEIAKDANTQIKGDLQKGAKVTVDYTMSATNIEVKPGKAKK